MNNYCTSFSLMDFICFFAHAFVNDTQVTYHSFVLLEWEHGKYCTVVEGAYMNGMSIGIGTTFCFLKPTNSFQLTRIRLLYSIYDRYGWIQWKMQLVS